MIISMNPDNGIVPAFPIVVFDRDGNEINNCLEVDTETGRVVQFRDPPTIIDDDGNLVKDQKFYPHPLKVVSRSAYEKSILNETVPEPIIVDTGNAKQIDSANLSARAG